MTMKKVIDFIEEVNNYEIIYRLLEFIYIKCNSLIKYPSNSNILASIINVSSEGTELLEKIIILCIQNIEVITPNVIKTINDFVSQIETDPQYKTELFLKLMSASSLSAILSLEAMMSPTLWASIFDNLISLQAINRKRSMYWLHRMVDSLNVHKIDKLDLDISNEKLFLIMNPELISDLFILLESLEEKQTHLIIPNLPRIESLKHFFSINYLSSHWLLSVLEKASLHDSTVIVKWSFSEFLNFPICLSLNSYHKFLNNVFIKTLNKSNLYFSPDSISEDRGFYATDLLTKFLSLVFREFSSSHCHDQFIKFLSSICSISWNSQALLFFAESFSKVSMAPMNLPLEVLEKLGQLCVLNLPTIELKYRRSVSSFFLTGFLHNYRVTVDQVPRLVRVLSGSFELFHTVLIDPLSMAALSEQLLGLSDDERHIAFCESTTVLLRSIDFTQLSAEVASNRLAAVSAAISILSRGVSDRLVDEFLSNLIRPIRDSEANPYKNEAIIMKAIVTLKQLLLLERQTVSKSNRFANEVSQCLGPLLHVLTIPLDTCSMVHDNFQNLCAPMARFFITRFPEQTLALYAKTKSQTGSVLHLLIEANINQEHRALLEPTLERDWLVNSAHAISGSLGRDRLVLLAQNISWILKSFSPNELLTIFTELLDTTTATDALIPLFELIGQSLPGLLESSETPEGILELVQAVWSRLLELLSSAQRFWPAYSVFLDRVLAPLLCVAPHCFYGDKLIEYVQFVTDSILDLGDNKFGLVHMLGDKIHSLAVSKDIRLGSRDCCRDFYLSLVCRLVLYGPCHRRSLRFENRVDRYLSYQHRERWVDVSRGPGDEETPGLERRLPESSDRVSGLLLLCLNDTDDKFRMLVIDRLIAANSDILANGPTASGCYRNYINNRLHRQRHRLFSALLICMHLVLPVMPDGQRHQVRDWLLSILEKETLSSVRHLAEWNLLLVLLANENGPAFLEQLLATVTELESLRPAYACSLVTVARHLLTTAPERVSLESMLLVVLPLSAAQNHNVRMHAVCFVVTVGKESYLSKPVAALVKSYLSAAGACRSGAPARNLTRLAESHWWRVLHPLNDLCLETVFEVLPRLFGLVEEEWVSSEQLQRVLVACGVTEECYRISIGPCRSEWMNSALLSSTERDIDREEPEVAVSYVSDVQRKARPWLRERPDEKALEGYRDKANASDLIVVASLIDKPANLGGLARAGDVFGLAELVVDNARVLADGEFRHLAVTADKWVDISEVSARALPAFLTAKRCDGYDIVGVEQTANSVMLQSATFCKRTVLVLGNEKDGIPADLISHLDRCIEIPQLGQIRSLNVHVTGALVMWEYAKQMHYSSRSNDS